MEAGLDLARAPWARLRQVYQLNDFRFRDDAQYGDNRLPVVPKHQYRAELRLGTDTFSMTPNIEWTPKGAWTDYSNTTRAHGYTLLGLSAEAVVRDGEIGRASCRGRVCQYVWISVVASTFIKKKH